MDGKSERAADPLRGDAIALLLGDVDEVSKCGIITKPLRGRWFESWFWTESSSGLGTCVSCGSGYGGRGPRIRRDAWF